MPIKTLTTSRDPKGLKFMATVEAVYNKADLDDERAQRLNESEEFVADLRRLVEQYSITSKFAGEEVKSSYAYPDGYNVKGIAEQVVTLREIFPELKDVTFDESIAAGPLPAGAEGCFAIPKWQTLAVTYGEAVEKVFVMIASKRKFYNYRDGQLGAKYLRQHAKTVKMFQKLGDEQKDHNLLVVPAQFGLRHRGRSVRRAREVFQANEFGLGAFAIGIMLLIYPERAVQWEQLHIDCAGDEYAPGADGSFDDAPCFSFSDGKLKFGASRVGYAYGSFGSASGFLPQ